MNLRRTVLLLAAALAFALMGAVSSADEKGDIAAIREALLADFGETYTDEELAAMDRALWAGNLTREDMRFNKDYTKGYACFPVVRAMMDDPLLIAPYMDMLAELMDDHQTLMLVIGMDFGWSDGEVETVLAECNREGAVAASEPVSQLEEGLAYAEELLTFEWTEEELEMLREFLPAAMAWHDVFDRTVSEERHAELEALIKEKGDAYIYELAAKENYAGSAAALSALMMLGETAEGWDASLFPQDEPLVVETRFGRIALGTPNDDYYEGEFAVLIEPGGNDTYRNCRIGAAYGTPDRRVGMFFDMGGDDFYDCGDTNITLGAAVLGAAVFADTGTGNDRYSAGSCTLGAAMGGCAVFFDDGGTDIYEGKTYTQGAAGFGVALMMDYAMEAAPEVPTDVETPEELAAAGFDNDTYTAWTNAQAFARTRGFAVCYNVRGNEVYHAGGVYLHAPLFADRYQSFSQGFAIGERGIDYAGGIALIIDEAGNDRYLGDVYNQGVGYWYSAGLLWDGGGNDTYEMTQYGQGSGIHLAVGGLVDCGGHDTYVMHSGLGQGGSHDYAASILHDRGGNDHYMGMTSCNGTGLTNSVGIHLDRSGDDTYAGRREGGVNWGRPERGTSSIGLLVDLGGVDDYLGIMQDNTMWRQSDIGVGIDVPPPQTEPAAQPENAANVVTGQAEIPAICSYEGPLTQEVFDELWEISIRWEVGDNRYIVPEARKRLIAFGPPVLPYLSKVMDNTASSLALRAFIDLLTPLLEQDAEGVAAVLRENAASGNETREMVALYLIGEMKLVALEGVVTPFLDDVDMQRRAIGVLAAIGSHAADARLKEMLQSGDERLIASALNALVKLEAVEYAELAPLLDYELMTVREMLANLLVANWERFGAAAKDDFLTREEMSARARRTLLSVLMRAEHGPDARLVQAVTECMLNNDWGVRGDAVRCLRRWQRDTQADYALLAPALKAMREMLRDEQEPYVLFAGVEEIS